MSEPKSHQLRPAIQIGICLVLIVAVRLYYAWIETQTYRHYPRYADNPVLWCVFFLGLVPLVSLIAAVAAYRYFSPVLTIPFAAVAGGTAGLFINSIPGALIGAGIGLFVYSRRLRRWSARAGQIFLRFAGPALVWGICIGSMATSLNVRLSDRATAIQIGMLVLFLVGLAALLFLVFRAYRGQPGMLAQAIVGCVIAGGLGLAVGPTGNTLYRIYSLNRVGYVTWNPIPRFDGFGNSIWETYGVGLRENATDAHLRLLPGLQIMSLHVEGADLSDEAFADVLPNLPDLELLEIEDVPVSDRGLAPLKAARRLIHVRLIGTSISDGSLASLANVPTLQVLHVDGGSLQRDGLKALARGGRLRFLQIENVPLTDAHLADLNGLQGLSSLTLRGTKITGSGLKHLVKLPRLNNLKLEDCPLEDRYLADLNPTALNFLSLDGIPLSDEGATAIAAMPNLLGLSLRRAELTDDQLKILSQLPPTTQLALDGQRLTSESTDKLAAEDVSIFVDNAEITVEDIERLIAIGHEVRLTNCHLDEASIQRLAMHKTKPSFLILTSDFDTEMHARLKGGYVQVVKYRRD